MRAKNKQHAWVRALPLSVLFLVPLLTGCEMVRNIVKETYNYTTNISSLLDKRHGDAEEAGDTRELALIELEDSMIEDACSPIYEAAITKLYLKPEEEIDVGSAFLAFLANNNCLCTGNEVLERLRTRGDDLELDNVFESSTVSEPQTIRNACGSPPEPDPTR